MKTEELFTAIDNHLQSLNNKEDERIKAIKELLDFLNYNLRLTELTAEEKQDFIKTIEGNNLSDACRDKINNAKSETEKNYYVDMYARANYFRKCAWMDYLYGKSNEKPTI